MAAHTHWRITCDGLDYVQLAEVAFLSAGLTDLSVGGTASASSEYSAAFPASAAFDKDASGSWWCTAPGSLPAWLAYAHPTAVEPVYVRITSHTAYPPISLGLQHSDDGITWSAAVPLIFSSGGPIASGAATVFVPSVGSRPIVWQSNEVRELPAEAKLPADVIPSHGHAMGDVAGLDAALNGKLAATNPAVTGTITEDVYAIVDAEGVAVDPANGSIQTWTLGANRTPTLTGIAAGQAVTLEITASAYAITWTGVTWVKVGGSGTAPTLSTTGVSTVVLWKVGSTLKGCYPGST